jgi:hypothetical protein
MDKNIGDVDRMIRIGAGIILILLTLAGVIGVWGWIGVVPLATGLIRRCPSYLPFGINTCKSE